VHVQYVLSHTQIYIDSLVKREKITPEFKEENADKSHKLVRL